MKHRHAGRVLSRGRNQRRALIRTLLGSLILHERIITTEAKAKEIKNFIDQIINKVKVGRNDAVRRVAITREFQSIIPEVASKKLLGEFGVRFEGRVSGYTRIVKLERRKSDAAEMAIIEFV
ncbi:MAG: 50S ribosomal protein L17 [Candidatus Moranbacteria bacterium CG_4_9_14_3_um_filter_45_14]|nr:MAG: 50S ribosomal protein L17 [Candidatus Moranbacteria bacterium CG2_30_45_14]PJA84986.1 MAG: 50S ribosomal protein L17 [Candidatus Moranbacteria bacterium CG_4_9_14_3_um_filter_45_14]